MMVPTRNENFVWGYRCNMLQESFLHMLFQLLFITAELQWLEHILGPWNFAVKFRYKGQPILRPIQYYGHHLSVAN